MLHHARVVAMSRVWGSPSPGGTSRLRVVLSSAVAEEALADGMPTSHVNRSDNLYLP